MKSISAFILSFGILSQAFAVENVNQKSENIAKPYANQEEIFKKIDTNSDGFLSKDELQKKRDDMFKNRDKDANGKLSVDEFIGQKNHGKDKSDAAKLEDRKARFAKIDKNNDGFISQDETGQIGEGERFKKIDSDGDDKISLDEFKKFGEMKFAKKNMKNDSKKSNKLDGGDKKSSKNSSEKTPNTAPSTISNNNLPDLNKPSPVANASGNDVTGVKKSSGQNATTTPSAKQDEKATNGSSPSEIKKNDAQKSGQKKS